MTVFLVYLSEITLVVSKEGNFLEIVRKTATLLIFFPSERRYNCYRVHEEMESREEPL